MKSGRSVRDLAPERRFWIPELNASIVSPTSIVTRRGIQDVTSRLPEQRWMSEPCAPHKAFRDSHIKRLPIFVSALLPPRVRRLPCCTMWPKQKHYIAITLRFERSVPLVPLAQISFCIYPRKPGPDMVLVHCTCVLTWQRILMSPPLPPFNPFLFLFLSPSPPYAWAHFCFGNWLTILVKHGNLLPVC